MNGIAQLTSEWERIDLLGACVSASRRGVELPEGIESRLQCVHNEVIEVRQQEPWLSLTRQYELSSLDQDILTCTLASDVDPRLGWMYQELQSGIAMPFPTPALMREMFLMTHDESRHFYDRLQTNSALLRHRLIEASDTAQYQPILPTPHCRQTLLGFQASSVITLPGALQIPAQATWDDIVLPETCLRKLQEYLFWVTQREKIENEWGAKVPGGPVALFCGGSGTGKTLAAEVIANALGWPLYRVDLGLLVSKYIGETEKNLNALFDAAENQPVVLLFDEADSLFGKRAEVKDARDRYANMEVSHLLSRIERYRGPCILTSNFRRNIDSAFTRRFQLVVEFPLPNEAARARLWRMHLPPKAPIGPDIDVSVLGREINLTGGQIKNAALHAAFLAAGDQTSITIEKITNAVWTELGKKEGELSPASLGKLAPYLVLEAGG